MPIPNRKIINDPVYGFISIDHPLLFKVIEHPYYQRLRRISQMALAQLVYPGAVHTRLLHSLGAYHLMTLALEELQNKGIPITEEEILGAKLAILLHDIGHGPFSHALESTLVENISHEEISMHIMETLNKVLDGQLDMAISIFKGEYSKKFLHQLVSSQLDVDRMDYLNRDSFYTGVYEGVIGYDRIIKMMTVYQDELVVEEKAIHSIEKFIIARRLMYWQVYLHKTVLCAENMLVKILTRAKELAQSGISLPASHPLTYFLYNRVDKSALNKDREFLHKFCQLDDYDIFSAIKSWSEYPDKILQTLCNWLINRKLLKIELRSQPFEATRIQKLSEHLCESMNLTSGEAEYFVFTDVASNRTYNINDEKINILFKSGDVKDISSVENALISHTLSTPIKKFYICYPKQG